MLMCILYIKRCSIFLFDMQLLFFYNFLKEIDILLKSYEQEVLMTKEESVRYIANVALISAVDGKLSPLEARLSMGSSVPLKLRPSRVYVRKSGWMNLVCIKR